MSEREGVLRDALRTASGWTEEFRRRAKANVELVDGLTERLDRAQAEIASLRGELRRARSESAEAFAEKMLATSRVKDLEVVYRAAAARRNEALQANSDLQKKVEELKATIGKVEKVQGGLLKALEGERSLRIKREVELNELGRAKKAIEEDRDNVLEAVADTQKRARELEMELLQLREKKEVGLRPWNEVTRANGGGENPAPSSHGCGKDYRCAVCHQTPVDAENGYDTCPACVARI